MAHHEQSDCVQGSDFFKFSADLDISNCYMFSADDRRYIHLSGSVSPETRCGLLCNNGLNLGVRLLLADGRIHSESRARLFYPMLVPDAINYFECNIELPETSHLTQLNFQISVDFLREGEFWFQDIDVGSPAFFDFKMGERDVALVKSPDSDDCSIKNIGDLHQGLTQSRIAMDNLPNEEQRLEAAIIFIGLTDLALDPRVAQHDNFARHLSQNQSNALTRICNALSAPRLDQSWIYGISDESLRELVYILTRRNYDFETRMVANAVWQRFSDRALRDLIIFTGSKALPGMAGGWMFDPRYLSSRCQIVHDVILPYARSQSSVDPSSSIFQQIVQFEMLTLCTEGRFPTISSIRDLLLSAKTNFSFELPGAHAVHLVEVSPFSDPTINLIKFVAWSAPDFLKNLATEFAGEDFERAIVDLQRLSPIYMVITDLGFPMGGGEAFMHQTCRMISELGIRCVWVSFADKYGRPYNKDETLVTSYYIDVRRSGGLSKESISAAISEYAPDVVHCQGRANDFVEPVTRDFRTPTLTGFHFWNGLVSLGPSLNKNIVKNIGMHSVVSRSKQPPFFTRYLASEFMEDVYRAAGGTDRLAIAHPVSEPAHYRKEGDGLGRHVLQINIVNLKGGRILLKCIQKLGDKIPFLAVESEPDEGLLFEQIEEAVKLSPDSIYTRYGDVRTFYSMARIVLVPTLVDETFCRVAFEAAMNGIPVISTANGFLPKLFGETGIYLDDDPKNWVDKIQELYYDDERLKELGERQRQHLTDKFGFYPKGFLNLFFRALGQSPRRNIGFISVWGDQGLGNQVRLYSKLLRAVGWKVHIFSFQAYATQGESLTNQHDSAEWAVPLTADSVYYSYNNREEITINEVSQFVTANNIGPMIYPEVCWEVNWQKLRSISIPNLMICTVPNVETVRRAEALYHNNFTCTWYNTKICQVVLTALGVTNGRFVGHGLNSRMTSDQITRKMTQLRDRGKIRFLHVGGHNPFSRKQTPLVLEAFHKARLIRDDIELVITSMAPLASIPANQRHGVTIIEGTLSHADVTDLYAKVDVSIQVSSHEGLGLGFYESIACGTPVISLDVPPHNEPIVDGVSGWLLPVQTFPLRDNDDAVVVAASFDTDALARLITRLTVQEVVERIQSTAALFASRFDGASFALRMVKAMP